MTPQQFIRGVCILALLLMYVCLVMFCFHLCRQAWTKCIEDTGCIAAATIPYIGSDYLGRSIQR